MEEKREKDLTKPIQLNSWNGVLLIIFRKNIRLFLKKIWYKQLPNHIGKSSPAAIDLSKHIYPLLKFQMQHEWKIFQIVGAVDSRS